MQKSVLVRAKKLRAKGMTQSEIASRLGCSQPTVARMLKKSVSKYPIKKKSKAWTYTETVLFIIATGVICDLISGVISDNLF